MSLCTEKFTRFNNRADTRTHVICTRGRMHARRHIYDVHKHTHPSHTHTHAHYWKFRLGPILFVFLDPEEENNVLIHGPAISADNNIGVLHIRTF